ncbi:MAG: phosphatase PAP2 family protein [Acidobacteriaceae bacterium]
MTRDEWFTLALLAAMTALMPLAGGPGAFFVWTAAGTLMLGIAAVANPKARGELLLLGFLLPLALIGAVAGNHAVLDVTRRSIDGDLLALDHGISPSVYAWFRGHALAWSAINHVYYALPFFGALVAVVSPRRMECARAWILAALLAPFFYAAFPAVGPAHLGDPTAPRNCIPSLHMTWALLCVVYVARPWRWVAVSFAGLTALATLGTGEHYLIDLVVAVPYTWGICRLEIWARRLAAQRRARVATPRAADASSAIALQESSR